MKVNQQTKTVFFFVFGLFLLISCKKELPKCVGNCEEIVFAGIVYDKTNNKPLSNQPIKITLFQNRFCLFCTSYNIASGNTGNDGRFSFTKNFDTSLLKTSRINIIATIPNNYIASAIPIGPGLSSPLKTTGIELTGLDQNAMSNIKFGFYPAALLHINLHRESITIPKDPIVDLDFMFDDTDSGWGIMQSASN